MLLLSVNIKGSKASGSISRNGIITGPQIRPMTASVTDKGRVV